MRANRLAHYLRTRGAAPETVVGLCLERSVDLVVALLAILKSGAAYVPLDSTLPDERLQIHGERERRRDLLSPSAALAHRFTDALVPVVRVDADRAAIDDNVRRQSRAHGHRGRPGVCDVHLGIDRTAEGRRDAAPAARQPSVMACAPPAPQPAGAHAAIRARQFRRLVPGHRRDLVHGRDGRDDRR